MTKPKDILSPKDYSNYRNVRAVSVFFALLGGVLALAGIGLALDENRKSQERMHPAVVVGIAVAGLAGVIGGIAALRGSRRWARLVYVIAALYVFAFRNVPPCTGASGAQHQMQFLASGSTLWATWQC